MPLGRWLERRINQEYEGKWNISNTTEIVAVDASTDVNMFAPFAWRVCRSVREDSSHIQISRDDTRGDDKNIYVCYNGKNVFKVNKLSRLIDNV